MASSDFMAPRDGAEVARHSPGWPSLGVSSLDLPEVGSPASGTFSVEEIISLGICRAEAEERAADAWCHFWTCTALAGGLLVIPAIHGSGLLSPWIAAAMLAGVSIVCGACVILALANRQEQRLWHEEADLLHELTEKRA